MDTVRKMPSKTRLREKRLVHAELTEPCSLTDFLRDEEEEQSRVYATCASSRLHAHVGLVRCQVHTR